MVADIRQAIDSSKRQPRDIAILCRTNEQPRSFETELRRANVPYVLIGGMSFFDRKEVRDILSYLKVIDNPHDEPALMRIINQPARGIGNAAQKRLVEEATARGKFLWDVLPDALAIDGVDAKTAAAVAQFRRLIEQFREPAGKNLRRANRQPGARQNRLPRCARQAVPRPGRARNAPRLARRNHQRRRQLRQAEHTAVSAEIGKTVPDALLTGFLDDMLLNERDDSDEKDSQLARNAVALMTLHSAKGLEFPQRLPRRHGGGHSAAQAFGRRRERRGHR